MGFRRRGLWALGLQSCGRFRYCDDARDGDRGDGGIDYEDGRDKKNAANDGDGGGDGDGAGGGDDDDDDNDDDDDGDDGIKMATPT